jgi:NAD+ kinase
MKKIKSIGVWAGPRLKNTDFLVEKLKNTLGKLSPEISVKLLTAPQKMLPGLENCSPVDLIMVLGGDGTILEAVRNFASWEKPFVGVNFGEVGFMCAIGSLDDELTLFKLVDGDCLVENRILIKGEVFRKTARSPSDLKGRKRIFSCLALSDLTVKSTENNKMITVGYSVNGGAEEEIRGNGMMVATPTGSTAYSLSCDGPVVMPSVESLIINAIAPHTLRFRPIVVEKNSRVVFRLLQTKGEGAVFWADMQDGFSLQIDDEVEITASPVTAQLIFFHKDYFFQAVKEKLK